MPPLDYVEPNFLNGQDGLSEVIDSYRAPLVIAAPEPWGWLQRYRPSPRAARMVESADLAEVEATEASLPSGDLILGIGGGTAIDNAKYIAWKRNLPLVTMPSVMSGDAFLTNRAAIREEGLVRYVGDVWPEAVIVDHALIQAGPRRLNRAGAAEILSIHTALADWKTVSEDQGEPYAPQIAQQAREIIVRLELAVDDIRETTPAGIDKLVELLSAKVALCSPLGRIPPEAGGEHLFAYHFEKRTGKRPIHGELIATGIFLMSRWQENDPQTITKLMDRLGMRYRPSPDDVTRAELRQTLLTLADCASPDQVPLSHLNRDGLSPEHVDRWLDELLK